MDGLYPYIACLSGAFALYLLLRPGPLVVKLLGTVIGFCTLAWLMVICSQTVPGSFEPGRDILFLVFGAIAISAAVRMITHPRPVYSALYFVMVVMSSAGLFLLLEAEFMAFALIIVYAGAILITYMFVLMLAQQASEAENVEEAPLYDRLAREPASAVVVGLILAGTLISAMTTGLSHLPEPMDQNGMNQVHGDLLESLPRQLNEAVIRSDPDAVWPPLEANQKSVQWDEDGAYVVSGTDVIRIAPESMPTNTQHVGWSLVHSFPASLELAGVILLLAMFGAVVLARRQVEYGEDELRVEVGLEPMHPSEDGDGDQA
ncbi:MAG: hypothetical protein CMJ24_05795 [Phycisphaerae bacterium]|nr:hypothetical protein [Phycisphaerae bacterium]|tara:strand:+ start:5111 stop:6064 length:954 start_codon:yes stop_codon:yes gene_type:complete